MEKKSRHGRHALKHPVKLRPQLDLRSAGAKALAIWRSELIDHLGGQDAVSVPQRFLVEKVVSTELYIQDADRDLLSLETTVQDHRYVALIRERQALIDSQARLLSLLGLDPTESPAREIPLAEAVKRERRKRERAERRRARRALQQPGVPDEPPPTPNAPGRPQGRAGHAAAGEPEDS